MSKIFCIGFAKTGTTSMRAALETLGFSVHGGFGFDDPKIAENAWVRAQKLVDQYDAFEDDPWPQLYRHLDHTYPASKFILTVRDRQSWLESMVRHCGNRSTPLREWIYGAGNPQGHETEYQFRFERHNADVREYFSGREDSDFLVMNIMSGDGWIPLCRFLNKPLIQDRMFPHQNRAEDRERLAERSILTRKAVGLFRRSRRRFDQWRLQSGAGPR